MIELFSIWEIYSPIVRLHFVVLGVWSDCCPLILFRCYVNIKINRSKYIFRLGSVIEKCSPQLIQKHWGNSSNYGKYSEDKPKQENNCLIYTTLHKNLRSPTLNPNPNLRKKSMRKSKNWSKLKNVHKRLLSHILNLLCLKGRPSIQLI